MLVMWLPFGALMYWYRFVWPLDRTADSEDD